MGSTQPDPTLRARARLRPSSSTLNRLGGAAVILPAFLGSVTFGRLAALDSVTLIMQIIFQGVFSGVLAVVAFGGAVERLGAAKAGSLPALAPAVALIIGLPVTGEVPTPWNGRERRSQASA